MAVQLDSKPFWQNLVATTQADAGEKLRIRASERSRQALENVDPPFQCFRPVTFNFYDYGWGLGPRTVIQINSGSNRGAASEAANQQQSDANRACLAVCIGVVFTGVFAGITGYLIPVVQRSFAAVNLTDTIKKVLEEAHRERNPLVNLNDENNIFSSLYSLVNARNKVDARNYEKVRNYLISSVVLLAGGATALIGGIMTASALITAGYIAIVAGGVFCLFNLGLHWSDAAENAREYRAITGYNNPNALQDRYVEGLAEKVQRLLPLYQEDMSRIAANGPPPPYQPVYPELPEYRPVDNDYQPGFNPYGSTLPSAPPAYGEA